MSQTIPTAEPFFLPGKGAASRIGCLVTHGFTGAPKEMRWMGEYLNHQGYNVCGMRLPGHATKPKDMIRSRLQDWLLCVEDGYNLLQACSEQVYLLGLSMGGALSLVSASRLPVRGVVAMSTPYRLLNFPMRQIARLITWLIPFVAKGGGEPGADWFDQEAFRQHVSYPQNPSRSAIELDLLLGMMRDSLPLVKAPVLLIHSRNDDYVFRGSMEHIHAALGSTDKHMLWVEGAGHVITEEPTKEAVFKAAFDFISRVSAV